MCATNGPITLDRFSETFLRKYFTLVAQHLKLKEFLSLEQGHISVTTYGREFTRLSRFSSSVADDKERKADFFIMGLRRYFTLVGSHKA